MAGVAGGTRKASLVSLAFLVLPADNSKEELHTEMQYPQALVSCPGSLEMKGVVSICQLLNRNNTTSFPTEGTPQANNICTKLNGSFLFLSQVSTQAKS